MQKKIRPDPLIPDHEVLRKIGGGAYGEVWLARGVTGAMRAVKIVYREDFSDERTFEREFEGILRFEPISRDHPGFVNILHVGRSDDQSEFYYYVMELGDDAHDEGEINPVEYEPRTLRTDMKRVSGEPLTTNFCIETGRRLAEALGELHERGLTHRDVKPSNVIFVDGKAKLADIGLVAAKDQRTFVGTEGFVPPEGPGSEQADIYGLGKVLYEMATGMDRLQFPELPDKGPGDDQRKKWIRLNRLICDICEPRVAKRKIKTGQELADAMRRLQRGKGTVKKVPLVVKIGMVLMALLGLFGSQIWIEKTWGTHVIEGKREPLPQRFVMVKLLSNPEGAKVFSADGELLDYTPATLLNMSVDEPLDLRLKAPGYRELVINEKVQDDGSHVMILDARLSLFSPPRVDEIWTDALGHKYLPTQDQHKSAQHVTEDDWRLFLKESGKKFQAIVFKHSDRKLVAVPEEWTDDYTQWLEEKCVIEGYFAEYSEDSPDENRQLVPEYDLTFDVTRLPDEAKKGGKILRPFYCVVRPIPYGEILIDSDPTGAYIYINGIPMGVTPYEDDNIAPGDIEITLELGGKETRTDTIYLADDQRIERTYKLEPNKSLVPGQSWTNSLNMLLEPFSDTLSVSAYETRSGDYREYLRATKQKPGLVILDRDPQVPVVGITRAECEAFCLWLTERERVNRITKDFRYRLPSDQEWSLMVGLLETGGNPAERDKEIGNAGEFPWGASFPPPLGAGNYADLSAVEIVESEFIVEGYLDGFPQLAPVGKFAPNILGLFDLGGNVYEWVSDDYVTESRGVLRGGAWNSFYEGHLESRFRYAASVDARRESFGFRVVLAKDTDSEQKEAVEEEQDGRDQN